MIGFIMSKSKFFLSFGALSGDNDNFVVASIFESSVKMDFYKNLLNE